MPPLRSPGPSAVPIQSGRWSGERFSKKLGPSTPSGYRRRVTPRSHTWGSMAGATRT